MNDKQLEEFVELLKPHIIKAFKEDASFKNVVKRKNATVVNTTLADGATNIRKRVEVQLPYDTKTFFVVNETGEDLKTNDLVCIEYCIDLKNAVAVYKVE